MRAVVLVSGGDAVTPFTTPNAACGSGLAAGNTCTALREHLLREGFAVFTAPAMNATGTVKQPPAESFGAFGEMPEVLPAESTINSRGDIDEAGTALARFVELLADRYGVTEIDWIGHSNGGLFARSATRILQQTDSVVRVRSLITLGTPWCGAMPLEVVFGELTDPSLRENAELRGIIDGTQAEVAHQPPLARQQLWSFLEGWNADQAGVLADVPSLLIGGSWFSNDAGDPHAWPLDGLVSVSSAHATRLPRELVPLATRKHYSLTHSIFISNLLGLDWQTALTWNTDVLTDITAFLRVRA